MPPSASTFDVRLLLPPVVCVGSLLALYGAAAAWLSRDWLRDPDAGHGLLLTPLAAWLAWRTGSRPGSRPRPWLGAAILAAAVAMRYLAVLAAELFTMRISMWLALVGLIVAYRGVGQLLHWWLPATLLALSIPLPAVVIATLALPLQLQATWIGAELLAWRDVPVLVSGNVLHLPGRSLFVTEACSGLRSLSALVALGLLIGAFWLRRVPFRVLLLLATVPLAVLLNGFRVFLTGFLIHFVDPRLGDEVMHLTEGWLIFGVAFGLLSGLGFLLARLEGGPAPEVAA